MKIKEVKIINEKDKVEKKEISYGENERLEERVEKMMGEEIMIMI